MVNWLKEMASDLLGWGLEVLKEWWEDFHWVHVVVALTFVLVLLPFEGMLVIGLQLLILVTIRVLWDLFEGLVTKAAQKFMGYVPPSCNPTYRAEVYTQANCRP